MGSLGSLMLAGLGWHRVFYFFGTLGLFWVLVWRSWFIHPNVLSSDQKVDLRQQLTTSNGAVNAASDVQSVPWGTILRHPAIWYLDYKNLSESPSETCLRICFWQTQFPSSLLFSFQSSHFSLLQSVSPKLFHSTFLIFHLLSFLTYMPSPIHLVPYLFLQSSFFSFIHPPLSFLFSFFFVIYQQFLYPSPFCIPM